MSSNFSSLRNSRTAVLAKLNEELKKESTRQGADERFWKLSVDQKTKVGYARFRFLPAPAGEDVPWQRLWNHAFKFGGQWFIENCPTTLANRPCPVCKNNSKLWETGIDANKSVASERKRKLQYISNIVVIDDPAHPENNGKNFLYKYGKKIKDKVQELINPQFPDQVPTNPFDMWEGADFKLKAQQVQGYQNYDKSEFAEPKELFPGDDAKKETTWEKEYALLPFVAENQFKNYEDIEKRFLKVTVGDAPGPRTAADAVKADQPTMSEALQAAVAVEAGETPVKRRKAKAELEPEPFDATSSETEEDQPEPEQDIPEDEDAIKAFFSTVLE